jgi:hypothetical protein
MPRISEFDPKRAPSASAFLAGVDAGENDTMKNVKIPFSVFGEYRAYSYQVVHDGVTMRELIGDLKSQGYNCEGLKQSMVLTLSESVNNTSRIFSGYITSYAAGHSCQFELFDLANHIKYSQLETTASTVPISTILNNARPVKYVSSGVKYVTIDTDETTTFADIATAIEDEGGSVLGINFVKLAGSLNGSYLMNCYMYSKTNAIGTRMLDLNNLTQYHTSITGLTSTLFGLMVDRTYGSVTEVGGGGLPYESVLWNNPMTDMLDKVTEHVSANSPQKTIIQVYGYNSALLLASGNRTIESGKDIWTLSVTNLYNGKMLYAEDVDPTTITLSDFLNSGKYEVKQESSGGSPMTSITYAELKALRDSGSLVAGMFYRITDYQCTTVQENTGAMANQFDIIVQALNESTLSETASADRHEGDTYFADSNLGAWELRYCLDNDTTRFAWADTENGKGVIYYMKDEFGNECPYDFKNITYKGESIHSWNSVGLDPTTYYPTFTLTSLLSYRQWGSIYGVSRKSINDTTIGGVTYYGYVCSENPSAWGKNEFYVTDEVITSSSNMYFVSDGSVTNISFGGNLMVENYYDTSINGTAKNNIIRECTISGHSELPKNIIIGYSTHNILDNGCVNNTISASDDNTFSGSCSDNTIISSYRNSFGTQCCYNTLQVGCNNNYFNSNCSNITLGESCQDNEFGATCMYMTLEGNCRSNTFEGTNMECALGYGCYNNTFGKGCNNITFASDCSSNIIEAGCYAININVAGACYVRVCQGLYQRDIAPAASVVYQQVFKVKNSVETEL